MRCSRGSAFIPDGLLPKKSDDPAKYSREYDRLRRKHDPFFRKYRSKKSNDYCTKRYNSDPEFRARKLAYHKAWREKQKC